MRSIGDTDLPISDWLNEAKSGNQQAFEEVWRCYFSKLVCLVRRMLQQEPLADAEEVVGSALASFYFRARDGQYPDLSDRDDLWKLLMTITLNKSRAVCRTESNRRTILQREFGKPGDLASKLEPSPDVAVSMADSLQSLLSALPDDVFRRIAVAKLEGRTNREIAEQLRVSVPTIERKLSKIRKIWEPHQFDA